MVPNKLARPVPCGQSLREREDETEGGAVAARRHRFEGEVAAVGEGDAPGDGQAEAGAAPSRGPGAVDAGEGLEDVVPVLGRDGGAVVGDPQPRPGGAGARLDLDRRTGVAGGGGPEGAGDPGGGGGVGPPPPPGPPGGRRRGAVGAPPRPRPP